MYGNCNEAHMLLSRRVPPNWRETLRSALWPRTSWARSLRYGYLRLLRARAQPRHLALGAAAGIFVAVLPIPGLQLLAAAALAWLVRGHSGAALVATFAANPVTYPIIWIASYVLGATMLGTPVGDASHSIDAFTDIVTHSLSQPAPATAGASWAVLGPILTTLMIGALPLAAVSAAAAYAGVWRLLRRRVDPVRGPGGATRRPLPRARVSKRKRVRLPLKAAA
jgi:uncharacterized protein